MLKWLGSCCLPACSMRCKSFAILTTGLSVISMCCVAVCGFLKPAQFAGADEAPMLALQAPENAPEDLTGDEDPSNERGKSSKLAPGKDLFQSTAAGLSVLAYGSGEGSCRCERTLSLRHAPCYTHCVSIG